VTPLHVELDRREREVLRDLFPERAPSGSTLELVEASAGGLERRVLQRVDASSGPVRGALDTPVAGALALGPVSAGVPGADVDLAPLRALEVIDARLRRLRLSPGLLREDGVYALALSGESPPVLFALRLRAGRPERLTGGAELGWDGVPTGLPELLRLRLGRPRLVLAGELAALRALIRSARPASALEHASIRGEVEALYVSRRLALGLPALRLLGL
jgi:hypothetical protein